MFFNISFSCFQEDSKKQFKTFDEYKLEGIPFTDTNRELYVIVNKQKDSIKVQISDDLSNPVYYINQKGYWYSYTSKILETNGAVSAIECNEKYIYNDTILNYNYQIQTYNNITELGSDLIFVETKDRLLYLFYDLEITKMIRKNDSIDDKFKALKEIVDNYKDIFIPMKYPITVYPIRYYDSYLKVMNKDTLFIYSDRSANNSICLEKARLLNNLGEFDPIKGVDIFGKVKNVKKCN